MSQTSQEKTCVGISFLIKFQAGGQAWNFIQKEIAVQVFSWDFFEILKKTYFAEISDASVGKAFITETNCYHRFLITNSVEWCE